MMIHDQAPLLEARGLCKRYPSFDLKDVSFTVNAGSITGFIGRNGAGKSTTLKCLEGSVHPDAGTISYFGEPFVTHENKLKEQIGFVLCDAGFYRTKRLSNIAAVTSRFYPAWDASAYEHYCTLFDLDQHKRIKELSSGMKVKFALALALSHHSKLLVLDEPTSGLDPASRNEVLTIFLELARARNVGILFSTHITSDLDRCADHIIYIDNGALIGSGETVAFRDAYRVMPLDEARARGANILGVRRSLEGDTALVPASNGWGSPASLDDIMSHTRNDLSEEVI